MDLWGNMFKWGVDQTVWLKGRVSEVTEHFGKLHWDCHFNRDQDLALWPLSHNLRIWANKERSAKRGMETPWSGDEASFDTFPIRYSRYIFSAVDLSRRSRNTFQQPKPTSKSTYFRGPAPDNFKAICGLCLINLIPGDLMSKCRQ